MGQPSPGLASQGKADGREVIGESKRLPFSITDNCRRAFTEDMLRAVLVPTAEAANTQTEEDGSSAAGKIADGARVVAAQMPRLTAADRTAGGASVGNRLDDGGVIVVQVDRQDAE